VDADKNTGGGRTPLHGDDGNCIRAELRMVGQFFRQLLQECAHEIFGLLEQADFIRKNQPGSSAAGGRPEPEARRVDGLVYQVSRSTGSRCRNWPLALRVEMLQFSSAPPVVTAGRLVVIPSSWA
jgi:hypothetical protein